jgi:DNA mismatch repair ATPase MutS
VHVACELERWNVRHGAQVDGWFDALADLDALATLAGLAHDEPAWTYPTIDPAADALTTRGLGHPLIVSATRVGNDVTIGPPGTVLVITGSNMSGKSTLLRGTGLNITLAQLGAPVCAAAMTLPSVRLDTSIRIADSLAQGVSYFMAALLRLKTIVEAADRPREAGDARVLYLLDEVLQGTNSEERQVAIRHIVRHLAGSSAIGALTTHDLHLVEAPEFRAHAQHVHFTEHLEEGPNGPVMTFDYMLRPGPAQSRNALALVRMVGLGDASLMTARPSPDYDASTED